MMISGFSAAESVWEGNASMSMYGEFPQKGFYAASNSFERNTLIEVENLDTGKKTTVIVADRLSEPGLFLLLSREASQELGIKQDELVRVRVTLAHPINGAVSEAVQESPYHPDPDVNPSAAITGDYTVPEEAGPEEEPVDEVLPEDIEPEPDRPIVDETTAEPPEAVVTAPEQPSDERELPQVETPRVAEMEGRAPEQADEGPLSASLAAVIDIPEAPSEEEEAEQPEGGPEEPPKERVKFLGASDLASSPKEKDYSFEQPDMPQEPVLAAAPLEEETDGTAERVVPEKPEVEELTDSPRMDGVAFLDLDIPQEPEEAEEPEETEAHIAGGPHISGLEESPRIEEIDLYAMDVPEAPEREDEAEAGPEVTELAESPESPGVEPVASLAVPVEPSPEIVDLETEEPEELALADETALAEEPADLPEAAEEEREAEAEPAPEEEIEASVDVPALDEDAEIVLRPAEPRPPGPAPSKPEGEKPVREPEKTAERPAYETPDETPFRFETTAMLAQDSYYVQLGVYSEPQSVEQVVSSLSPTFPVTVYKPSELQYKVLLGPLNQDESGSVLFNIKAKGYTDAFIRRGNRSN